MRSSFREEGLRSLSLPVRIPGSGQRPDAVLHHIVVYLVTAIGDVERQFLKDLIGVGDGLLHQRLRRALEDVYLHPSLELLDFRISLFLPQGLPVLIVWFVVCRIKKNLHRAWAQQPRSFFPSIPSKWLYTM